MDRFKVCVQCYTYNHINYIEAAMSGFVDQKTSFPFLVMLVDDASTDGTNKIIERFLHDNFIETEDCYHEDTDYAEIHFLRHKTNDNCYFVVYFLKENHFQKKIGKAKYIEKWRCISQYEAICEGDDYWIDPNKLECQASFLDANMDYSACFHNAFVYVKKKDTYYAYLFNEKNKDEDLSIEEAVNEWVVPTASMMYRVEYRNVPSWMAGIYSGDYPRILYFMSVGKMRYFNKVSSVYRVVVGGNSLSQSVSNDFVRDQYIALLNSYNKGTNYKFDDTVRKKIDLLVKQKKFHLALKKHRYYLFPFMLPQIYYYIRLKLVRLKKIVNTYY